MSFFSVMGKIFKPMVNVSSWIGWREITSNTKDLRNLAKDVLRPNVNTTNNNETFAAAVKRLQLSDKDIEKRANNHFKLAMTYIVFAILVFFYAIYLCFWQKYILATGMALSLSLLLLAYAYKEHFHYFQLKVRKLGCSYKDWAKFTFKRQK